MNAPAPHTLTTDELLRFHVDSPLAPALREALEQLEQAAKALTAARSLQEAAQVLATAAEDDTVEDLLDGLTKHLQALQALETARETFEQVDDGELGA